MGGQGAVERLGALVGQCGECGSSVDRVGIAADQLILRHAVGERGEAARAEGHGLRQVRHAPGERTGTFRLGGDDLLIAWDGTSFISAEDYAVALVDEAEKSTAIRHRITVTY
ncbi:hypothetical protein GCM10023080_031320 [Streptomyces pseudoechinosporeus]